MKKVLFICLSFVLLGACKEEVETVEIVEPEATYELLELSTTYGNIYMTLYDGTPLHKHNFDSLVRAQFYDDTEFHRCVTDFVIQGGSPTSKDDNRTNDGSGSVGYTIPAEIDSARYKHFYGALAAARTDNPEKKSSGSQFYIVTNTQGAHFLDGAYTTFGKVVGGMDVAKTIEGQPKNSVDMPHERIKMEIKYVTLTETDLIRKGIVL